MNIQRTIIGILSWLACLTASAQAQRFFNLTVEDVAIDSVLPQFSYAIPLGENYADSVYDLEIRYPEFIDMSKDDEALYNAITAEVPAALPEIHQQITIARKKGTLEFSLVPIVERGGKKQFLVSFMIALTSRPVSRSVRKAMQHAPAKSSRYAGHSVLASGKWAKIRVPANGIYQLTPALIRQAGFSHPDKVKVYGYGGNLQNETLVDDYLRKFDDLPEVPTCTVDGKRLFYGRGPVSWESKDATRRTRNPYSQYGYYFLTESDAEPLTVDSVAFLNENYPKADDYHSLYEVDNYAWFAGGRNLFDKTPLYAGKTYKYVLPNAAKTKNGKLSVGITTGIYSSSVSIALNDSVLGTATVKPGDMFDKGYELERVYTVRNLQATDTISIIVSGGGPARLDYISIAYDSPRPMPNLSAGSFATPEFVYNITNQDHHSDKNVDMVIIIPTNQKLLPQAQRLAEFHQQHDGVTVRVVPADELYNEYSSGTPDAMAYRRYLKMMYDRAEDDSQLPKSLLLFGDCVWDNRMLTADCSQLDPDNYLLAYESENSFSLTDCYVNDGWLTLMDDGEGGDLLSRDREDLGVGRFAVSNVSDAQTMVDKTISYAENANAGSWENVIMFMGDDGNNNLHMRDVNQTAETIMSQYPGYQVKKVMWDAYTRVTSATGNAYPDVSRLIKQQQAQGALIMDYAGHGSEIQISHESVLRQNDFTNFTNDNLPLWITASCDIMPYDGTIATIGEESMLNKKGGSVAFWGTTRTVYANYNKAINTAFLRHVLSFTDGKPTTIGEAQRLAKCEMIDSRSDQTRNKLQYALLGDPALSLNLPRLKAVIDSIDGIPVGGAQKITLKGGAVAKVVGHIVREGELQSDFQGRMTATVRDTRELITCKKQEETSASAFQFYDRQKVLYNGSGSVRDGRFSFIFAVPRDLNYADGTGLINIYAVNEAHTLMANGDEEGFYINGSEQVSTDSIGPSVYCYLNSPSFVNGGSVNTTPYFVAEVSDKDGINASGNGIGHDMQLIIDGDMAKTYTLNDNFAFDFGSYTKGSTHYSIPELSEGVHQLKFRVWDILNNPSEATLTFKVVKGLAPNIESISCTNNPATTNTTFIVAHDYIGSNVDVEVQVFDTSGRILWQHKETGVSSGNTYTVEWNLVSNGGAALKTGVYLYRVRLGCDGAMKESKAKKLVILNNN
ncbi:type IX secretion system sortase PorU [Prevotella dentasini]